MTLTILDELEARGEARGRVEGEARGRVEGEARGRVEGEARGRVEGEARGVKKAIVQVLESRFQSSLVGVKKKLSKITNTEQLTVLLERALYCESLKAFADSIH